MATFPTTQVWILIAIALLVVAVYINFRFKALKYFKLENKSNSKETAFVFSYVVGNMMSQGKVII